MEDEPALLEQRIAWLERQVVDLIWGMIALMSLIFGFLAYKITVERRYLF